MYEPIPIRKTKDITYREYLIANVMVTMSAQLCPELASKRAIAYADAVIRELEKEEYESYMNTPDDTPY